MITPVRYNPSFDVLEEDEAKTEQGFIDTLLGISNTTYLVATPYAVSMPRVTPCCAAIKIIGVGGARVDGSESVTQDFIMVNGPVFSAPTGKKFPGNLKLLAGTTDKVPTLKLVLSAALRRAEKVLAAVGTESATLKSLGGHPETNPLGETYFSQVPVLFGDYVAKLSLRPASPEVAALKDAPVDLKGTPDGLRHAMQEHFSTLGGTWEPCAQLCTDLATMPIEDAMVAWKQEDSPWHAVTAHRPLGSIMRIRKAAYQVSQKLRADKNGVPIVEPKDISAF